MAKSEKQENKALNPGIEKPTGNFTMFPNCILDNLALLTSAEYKVLSWMIRRSYGMDIEYRQDEFSLSYLQKNTGLNRNTIIEAVSGLVNKQQILPLPCGPRGVKKYAIIWRKPQESKKVKRVKNQKYTALKLQSEGNKKLTSSKIEHVKSIATSSKIEHVLVQKLNIEKEQIYKNREREREEEGGEITSQSQKCEQVAPLSSFENAEDKENLEDSNMLAKYAKLNAKENSNSKATADIALKTSETGQISNEIVSTTQNTSDVKNELKIEKNSESESDAVELINMMESSKLKLDPGRKEISKAKFDKEVKLMQSLLARRTKADVLYFLSKREQNSFWYGKTSTCASLCKHFDEGMIEFLQADQRANKNKHVVQAQKSEIEKENERILQALGKYFKAIEELQNIQGAENYIKKYKPLAKGYINKSEKHERGFWLLHVNKKTMQASVRPYININDAERFITEVETEISILKE